MGAYNELIDDMTPIQHETRNRVIDEVANASTLFEKSLNHISD